jgi:hypothetical protein
VLGEMRGQKIDKRAHLARQIVPVRIDRVDGEIDRLTIRQKGDESAAPDIVADNEGRSEKHAVAG